MNKLNDDEIKRNVRDAYTLVAKSNDAAHCGCGPSSCCGDTDGAITAAVTMGYDKDEIENLPVGANMGLGCGNPQAIANLSAGEIVVDLGSGGGIDVFLASKQVTNSGHVIGVDMTPDMLSKARANALKGGYTNVEFRLGEIENIPVADGGVDVIISNCVVNLAPDKEKVYKEAFRILKPGGRIAISDIVLTGELSEEMRADPKLYSGCVSGALNVEELTRILEKSGFEQISVTTKDGSRDLIRDWTAGENLDDVIISANIEGIKPA